MKVQRYKDGSPKIPKGYVELPSGSDIVPSDKGTYYTGGEKWDISNTIPNYSIHKDGLIFIRKVIKDHNALQMLHFNLEEKLTSNFGFTQDDCLKVWQLLHKIYTKEN